MRKKHFDEIPRSEKWRIDTPGENYHSAEGIPATDAEYYNFPAGIGHDSLNSFKKNGSIRKNAKRGTHKQE